MDLRERGWGQKMSTGIARQRTHKAVAEPHRVEWGVPFVKRLFSYFSDDGDAKKLEEAWKEGAPNNSEVRIALETLFDIARSNKTKIDAVAEAITELRCRRCCSWEALESVFSPFLEGLEDERIDSPFIDQFVHSLFARLFHAFGKELSPTILSHLPKVKDDFHWSLLCKSLKELK